MYVIFDPWSKSKVRMVSMPHNEIRGTTSCISFVDFCQIYQLIKKIQNQKGLFPLDPTEGAAWTGSQARLFLHSLSKVPQRGPHRSVQGLLQSLPLCSCRQWLCSCLSGRGALVETSARQVVQGMRKSHLALALLVLNTGTATKRSIVRVWVCSEH